MNWVAKH